jgi:competence protein ComEC
VITAERGQVIDLGDGTYLEVLSPDRSVPNVDTNDACVVTGLVYGATSFMLSCDSPQNIEDYLVYLDGKNLHSDVLKAGHHGSKTSSSPLFVGFVHPTYAVYSRGCNNKYGFPHAETVATFKQFNIPTLDTCLDGTVTFESDGQKVLLK